MKKLGFGCMRLPLLEANQQTHVDVEQVCKMVDTFLERGFTYFDTAYVYHNEKSESIMREALVKRHPRNHFTIATKLPIYRLKAAEEQEQIFQEQLERCGVDFFDYYLLHNLLVDTWETAKRLDSFGFIRQKKAEGKIKNIGFSFHDRADLLDEILTAHPEVDFVQLQINYVDWDNESIQSRKCYEVAVKHNKPVIVMEPVKGGTLVDLPASAASLLHSLQPKLSLASWAIRYAASLEHVLVVLSGMSNLEQVLDNTSYMEHFLPLDAKEQSAVQQVADIFRESVAIPCTACRYCVKDCSKNIPIPEYFSLYNAEKQALNKGFSTQSTYYENLTRSYGKASDCIGCHQCERVCPQHIEIISWLRQTAQTFESNQ